MNLIPTYQRNGFSLIEVIVALVIAGSALLALAGTGTVTLRLATRARVDARLTATAAARLELLASQSCAALASGEYAIGAISENWEVSRDYQSAQISAQAATVHLGAPRSATHSTRVRCEVVP